MSLAKDIYATSFAMPLDLDEKIKLQDEKMEPEQEVWTEYLRRGNSMKLNVEGVLKQLNDLSPKLFSPPDKMQFDIMDVAGECAEHSYLSRTHIIAFQKGMDPVTLEVDLSL